jgi:glycosidase
MSLEGASLEGAMMHIAFILSVRGIPQLYSGEELGMEGKDDPDNRRDFPGGLPSDPRSAFAREGRRSDEERLFEWTRNWIHLRAEHSAIRHGRLIDLFADNDAYVFARQDKDETLIVAFNRENQNRQITVPAHAIGLTDGTELQPLIGASGPSRVSSMETSVNVPARTAVVFRASR